MIKFLFKNILNKKNLKNLSKGKYKESRLIIERAYWLAWSQISGIGPVLIKRIHQHFQTLEVAWKASTAELGLVEGLGKQILATITERRSQLEPEQFLQQHLQKNPHFWTPADPEYPRLLWEIASPPPVLYYRGQVNLEENQGITAMIGIVGTRYPTEHGRRWTHKISAALAKHSFTVVSGMAAGIDGQAHRSCLQSGGRTLAVLATGIDMVYPPAHRELYQQIQQQGLVLSEYPVGTRVDRGNFPTRNRIIAGLCRAILVIICYNVQNFVQTNESRLRKSFHPISGSRYFHRTTN